MADQENSKKPAQQDLERVCDASFALGRAWGLAETMCFQSGENPGAFDIEGVTRVVCSLVGHAKQKVPNGIASLEISAAAAVCDLILMDSREAAHEPDSPSSWAIWAMPFALQRAKNAVDAIHWKSPTASIPSA